MRRVFCLILTAAMLLAAGCACADQQVRLPESRYAVTLPDGMEYDGPGDPGKAQFAYVSAALGLDISFIPSNANGMERLSDLIPGIVESGMEDVQMTVVNGIEMLVYRYTPSDPGEMKCIGYILRDGDRIEEIAFWYATQAAADMTKKIMESIEDTGTV